MQYNIDINQRAIVEAGLDIDLEDAAIIHFIRSFSKMDGVAKIEYNGKTYYWFSYKKVLDEMPLLKMKKDTLYRRFRHMEELLLLEAHPDNSSLGKSYYALTPLLHSLYHSTPGEKSVGSEKSTHPSGNKSVPPPEKTTDNHTTSNHTTISSNTPLTPQGDTEAVASLENLDEENTNTLGLPEGVEERMVRFKAEVTEVGGTIYTKAMLDRFYDYWTELDRGRKPRMRFEKEKVFEVRKRLNLWATNNLDKIQCYLTADEKTIAEKRQAFAKKLQEYQGKYSRKLLLEFYRHWSQPENAADPMFQRWEKEKFWDLATRLAAWADRNNAPQPQPQQ